MGFQVTITSKGQMTVPKNVREQLKIKPGDKCYAWVRNGEMIVIPRNKSLADLAGILGKPPNGKKLTVEQMNDAIGEGAVARYKRSTGKTEEE
ncbi:AbrB/MazE/SpoVT family DNA-binding domain-containing protein [Rhizobium oryzihabitans]|jgi:antitoxin PrlF|uniref:AbrB/MazE/SpoVT family DNA-binding domain-containing protein n=1 Tax=Rhizobium oryzihabitans TaxID=2267833 RepID=A0A7L5BN19_9HYPH|nr:AbrB/MazE/SpoVT family DNA-binding domain-containing protein [Rhizobium oryzihabitans]EGP55235.1 transcriptional regulator, AbrB family protein [Agrobacterium tumefaciens F2]MCW0981003.1 AbrB/MazE/SpoVT family DNA-binding domain-containing protein [Agrobacterium sp. BT-220-3]QCM07280.1 AbrB/MazE/SpoVT family DNA-binding domain-containing protein [Agrobacterium tumefaciens]CUX59750.1 Transcriptional regulator, AbrB family protein [Agrobacterium genomosp. 5 str. CFBP 6626]HBT68428.1 AbrB/MazE